MQRLLTILFSVLTFTLASHLSAQEANLIAGTLHVETPDTMPVSPSKQPVGMVVDTLSNDTFISTHDTPRNQLPDWWLNRIKSHTYNIKDSTVIYPKFAQFCVNVYNWADSFFNTYDPEYVQGTGKNWKAMVTLANWTDSYLMTLGKTNIHMLSNVYSNVGPVVSFMAVSVTYMANLNRLISHLPARQKRWELNFSTSLFWINAYYSSNQDGTVIRKFGDYDAGQNHFLLNQPFPNLNLRSYGFDVYYFANHKRYSQGAAYKFSKYQKKSQGSLLIGASISHQYIDFDFSSLPGAMLSVLPVGTPMHYNFTYNDFCMLLGYGYNWVWGRHWLFNVTALPSIGVKHCMPQTSGGKREMFSVNAKGSTSITYNNRSFFFGAFANLDIHWYNSSRISFANGVLAFGGHTGIRF